jgi:hypothetical protein
VFSAGDTRLNCCDAAIEVLPTRRDVRGQADAAAPDDVPRRRHELGIAGQQRATFAIGLSHQQPIERIAVMCPRPGS